MTRDEIVARISATRQWDVLVIGGGATGLGTAVEAASRGYKTLLLEAHDFAQGTSSRSTKLVHGGVRYLRQGNLKLVLEALRERGRMLRNAPHLAHRRAFIVPAYSFLDLPFYGIGLTLYDLLSGGESLGRSRLLSVASVRAALPTLESRGLHGGILYYDGQFDDARFAIALLGTLFDLGGIALNYAPVTGLLKCNSSLQGAAAVDSETGRAFEVSAKAVINATGIFSDSIRRLDEPSAPAIITASQGTHFVLPRSFLPSESALMVPRTADGRVLFAIPWHDRVLVGTTDEPVPKPELEPRSTRQERDYLVEHIERFLKRRPTPADVLSVWSGQRPLVQHHAAATTAAISRDHTILVSQSQLVTIVGGKWTTYRKMAEDTIDRAAPLAGLPRAASKTANLRLYADEVSTPGERLHPALAIGEADVVRAVRHEMARRLEDVLARRTRVLFLDARASIEAAPAAARLMAAELAQDAAWEREQLIAYSRLAERYIWSG